MVLCSLCSFSLLVTDKLTAQFFRVSSLLDSNTFRVWRFTDHNHSINISCNYAPFRPHHCTSPEKEISGAQCWSAKERDGESSQQHKHSYPREPLLSIQEDWWSRYAPYATCKYFGYTHRITLGQLVADIDPFQTERPVIFSLKAVGEATANFDEKRKIGEGGYGMVYLGFIGTHVRSSCSIFLR